MQQKKTFKELFEAGTFYIAASMPMLGGVYGAWAGATSMLATGAAAATVLGMGGAIAGVVVGAAVGSAGFVAVNALYRNKEYVALGMLAAASLPFALAGKALGNFGKKLSGSFRKNAPASAAASPQKLPAVPAEPVRTFPATGPGGESFSRAAAGGETPPKDEDAVPYTVRNEAARTARKPGS